MNYTISENNLYHSYGVFTFFNNIFTIDILPLWGFYKLFVTVKKMSDKLLIK